MLADSAVKTGKMTFFSHLDDVELLDLLSDLSNTLSCEEFDKFNFQYNSDYLTFH